MRLVRQNQTKLDTPSTLPHSKEASKRRGGDTIFEALLPQTLELSLCATTILTVELMVLGMDGLIQLSWSE